MYDNLLYQNVASLLSSDILNGTLPGAVLFSGFHGSGKLTCALETARILSCTGEKKGHWLCSCPSCLQHKALVSNNLLLAGPKDCTPEIAASSRAFLNAVMNSSKHLVASRYLFVRSVRKLTLRFSPVLLEGDEKLNKIAAVINSIDEELEPVDFPHELPPFQTVQKAVEKIIPLCEKLESEFLYDSIPVSQIRNAAAWARLKSASGKKTIIIENADRMLESVRNALLKILEEPPEDTVFVLTTSRRNAVMPTILSRVRTYNFRERSLAEQKEVISRVFHNENFDGTIDDFLLTFLPVAPDKIHGFAKEFYSLVADSKIPDCAKIIKDCGNFEPRIILKIFLAEIQRCSKKLFYSPAGAKAAEEISEAVQNCWNNVTVYNQSVKAALEVLVRDVSRINKIHWNILK